MQNLKPRQGTAFSLGVRGYKEGSTTYPNVYIPELKQNNRKGLGNYSLTRINAFETPDIKPRFVDFEKAQLLDLETQGITVRLDDKSLEELLKLKIPDPTDTLWIAEDRRLRAQYAGRMTPAQIEEVLIRNKPLGREQRMITSSRTIGSSLIKQDELLDAVKLEVQQGRAVTALEQKTLSLEMKNIINDINTVSTYSQQKFTDVVKLLNAINTPKTHIGLGLMSRIVDWDYFLANETQILKLFMINVANDKNGATDTHPVHNYNKDPTGKTVISFNTMRNAMMSGKKKYLDLDKRGIISFPQLEMIAKSTNGGYTNKDMFDIKLDLTGNPV